MSEAQTQQSMRDSAKQKKEALSSAVSRMIKAVKSATTDQLRLIIAQDIKLDINKCCHGHNYDAQVDDLKTLALLGSSDALLTLVSMATDISRFLASLMPHSESNNQSSKQTATNTESESASPQNSEKGGIDEGWRNEMEGAADQLREVITQNLDSIEAEFRGTLATLPVASISFPLRNSSEVNNPPSTAAELVSDFCDRLIQRKMNTETIKHIRLLATHAWEWPVLVSAEEYKSDCKLKTCAPYLRLGEAIAADIYSGSCSSKTPVAFATILFKILQKEKQIPRSKSHLNEWRIDEENDVPYTVEQLIKKTKAKESTERYSECIWNIGNIWMRKAALLPELSNETVSLWVDAAFAHAASTCDGNFKDYEWPDCIERRVQSLGSVPSAVKRVIKEGFEGLVQVQKKP